MCQAPATGPITLGEWAGETLAECCRRSKIPLTVRTQEGDRDPRSRSGLDDPFLNRSRANESWHAVVVRHSLDFFLALRLEDRRWNGLGTEECSSCVRGAIGPAHRLLGYITWRSSCFIWTFLPEAEEESSEAIISRLFTFSLETPQSIWLVFRTKWQTRIL